LGVERNVDFEAKFNSLSLALDPGMKDQLGDLTFLECDAFATELAGAKTQKDTMQILGRHHGRCILQAPTQDGKTTWKERCKDEEGFNR